MLQSYGWGCILFSDQILNFHLSRWNGNIEPHTGYANGVEQMLNSQLFSFANCTFDSNLKNTRFNIFNTIKQVTRQKSSIKHPYIYYILFCTCQSGLMNLASYCHWIIFSYNKDKNKKYRVCLSTLLSNVYHDAVSGWLMIAIASLFYKSKQYRTALPIIMYAITKCSPEKLYNHVTMSDIHYQILKLRSLNKKNIVFLLKIKFVNNVQFQMNSTLTPHELKTGIFGYNTFVSIHSVCIFP